MDPKENQNPDTSKPIPSTYLRELNKNRIVILLETVPLSNKYRQVVLTPAQLKQFTGLLHQFIEHRPLRDGRMGIYFVISENEIELPPEIKDAYTPEDKI